MSRATTPQATAPGRDQAGRKGSRGESFRAEQVYQQLLILMHDGDLGPGARVREEDVARLLGVSRTPVREAFSRLQARGLLHKVGTGHAIAVLKPNQVVDLYAMREILEGSAARFASQHASSAEIARLEEALEAFTAAGHEPRDLEAANKVLHEAIYEAAHNRYLLRALHELNATLALLPSTTFSYPERARQAVTEHSDMVSAIVRRQPDLAEQKTREHIRAAQQVRLHMQLRTPSSGNS